MRAAVAATSTRRLAGAAGLGYVLAAIALWVDPVDVGKAGPFELPPLGGRFAGAWLALLAVAAGWVVVRDRAQEAWLATLALIAVPAGALLGALRTPSDLSPSGAARASAGVALDPPG